ncbi:hypothetical protein J7M07_01075 [bacterium]|nr:hypothetical protein [bacterium]
MNTVKSRTADEIFQDMHRELRVWNDQVPESPERMDPILHILLRLYANQLASIDSKIDQTWESASNALIRSLYPEELRWPVPAYTVMRAEPSDPVVYVDPHTQFFYKEERDEGHNFFFSSLCNEKLLKAELKNIYFAFGNRVYDVSPLKRDSSKVSSPLQSSTISGKDAVLYVALEHQGQADDFTDSILFLRGIDGALEQLRLAKWLPCIDGQFYQDGGFCPGLYGTLNDIFSSRRGIMDWGGLRRSSDLFKPLENSFVIIPKDFVTVWRPGLPDRNFIKTMEECGIDLPEEAEKLYWIKILLPSRGDKSVFQQSFEMNFNCFIAVNRKEKTLFKHTGGNRLVEIEIPESINDIVEIISVADSQGNNFITRHKALDGDEKRFYTVIEENSRLRLFFDFSSEIELPPESITVNYSVTDGTKANGISAGKVSELYENHPGIISLQNITPVSGAIPAKTEEQIVSEVSCRLRGRDRAMTLDQIVNWAKTFDRRILSADCEKGVMRTQGGVRKCVVVKVTVHEKDFYSDDEINLINLRLESFLKARTSINSQFKVEVIKK